MSRQDWTILLLLALVWGGSFFFQQVALRSIAPLTLVLGRTALLYRRRKTDPTIVLPAGEG